jgi:hypothetical protein
MIFKALTQAVAFPNAERIYRIVPNHPFRGAANIL